MRFFQLGKHGLELFCGFLGSFLLGFVLQLAQIDRNSPSSRGVARISPS